MLIAMSTENEATKSDSVGLFLRAMVDREPGKRKVKPSKAALIDLAELDLGESSDDSDFNVDEAKLNDDDDISINSDPDANDNSDGDDDDDESEDDDVENEINLLNNDKNLSVAELLMKAKENEAIAAAKGIERPKILVCAVCLGDYSDDANEIVTCDGCRVSVHEGCYGISDTVSVSSTVSSCSTEPWFCDACKAGVDCPPCELCPNLGYTIFKETEMGRWVHLVCALYVPGVAFSEVDKLTFPTIFEMPYSRWGSKTCSMCEDERYCKTGVCIGCDAGMCRSYFHVTCAQREGLLSEVNHGEADQADPYYAHCKLHTDKELIRRRKRNWLALQLHMKQSEAERNAVSQDIQDRLLRKLEKFREKYEGNKRTLTKPWYPTQKMPRALSTSASLFRTLLNKTKLMGINTETETHDAPSLGDIRKRWHVPPAFNVEFISYYLDRSTRVKEMKSKLNVLLDENNQLTQEESELRDRYNNVENTFKNLSQENDSLLNKALELHHILKGLVGRPLPLPPLIASLHNPAPPIPQSTPRLTGSGGALRERRLITKGAAKMITDQPITTNGTSDESNNVAIMGDSLGLSSCSVCHQTREQHLLIQCDTCNHFYHLSCLDPPLTRMPKKTKQMGWQCSDCCKSSDSDKAPEIDTAAPRRLRRVIKESNKTPSIPEVTKATPEKSTSTTMSVIEKAPLPTKKRVSSGPDELITPAGKKRRKSSEARKKVISPKKRKKNKEEEEIATTTSAIVEVHAEDVKSPIPKPDIDLDIKDEVDSKVNQMDKIKKQNVADLVTEKIEKAPEIKVENKSPDKAVEDIKSKVKTESPGRSRYSRRNIDNSNSSTVNVDNLLTENKSSPTKIKKVEKEEKHPVITDIMVPPISISSPKHNSTDVVNNKIEATNPNVYDNKITPNSNKTTISNENQTNQMATNVDKNIETSNIKLNEKTKSQLTQEAKVTNNPSENKLLDKSTFPEKKNDSVFNFSENAADTESISNQTPMLPPPSTDIESVKSLPTLGTSLDISADSLPSTGSLHSPLSESLYSTEDDPTSPKKEKRHRDGSKKKKKDKDKDKDQEGRKKKKHHHRDKPEMSSEMVSLFKLKIKPLPPRPIEEESSQNWRNSYTEPLNSREGTNPPPPGYPPLPPGYTLTQPMPPDAQLSSQALALLHGEASGETKKSESSSLQRSSLRSPPPAASTPSSTGQKTFGNSSRRKSDPTDHQFSKCDVCKEVGGVTNTVFCDECLKAYHFNCLEPPLTKSPKRRGYSWFCEDCDNGTSVNLPKS